MKVPLIRRPSRGLLLRLLFRALKLDDFPAGIGSAGKTDVMRQLGTMALGALVQVGRTHAQVTAPFIPARFGRLSFW